MFRLLSGIYDIVPLQGSASGRAAEVRQAGLLGGLG
jgi:hypothetical protein